MGMTRPQLRHEDEDVRRAATRTTDGGPSLASDGLGHAREGPETVPPCGEASEPHPCRFDFTRIAAAAFGSRRGGLRRPSRHGRDVQHEQTSRPRQRGPVAAETRPPQRVLGNQGASQRWGRRGWMCMSVGLPYRPRVGRGRRSPAVLVAGSPAPLQGCGRRSGAVCLFGGAPHVDGPASSCETLSPPRGRQRAPSGFGRDGLRDDGRDAPRTGSPREQRA